VMASMKANDARLKTALDLKRAEAHAFRQGNSYSHLKGTFRIAHCRRMRKRTATGTRLYPWR